MPKHNVNAQMLGWKDKAKEADDSNALWIDCCGEKDAARFKELVNVCPVLVLDKE